MQIYIAITIFALFMGAQGFSQETPSTVPSLGSEDMIEARVMLRQFSDYINNLQRVEKELGALRTIAEDHRKKMLAFQEKALSDAKLAPNDWLLDFEHGVFIKPPAVPAPVPAKPSEPEWKDKWGADAKR